MSSEVEIKRPVVSAGASQILGSGEMADRIRSFPWQRTPLGPVESWPPELTCIVNMMIGNVEMACVCWGPEMILLYNDAYVPHLTDKHPALGKGLWDVWEESVEQFQELMESPYKTGKSFVTPTLETKLLRNGVLERVHYSITGNPIHIFQNGHDGVGGGYFTCVEHTASVLQQEKLAASQSTVSHLQNHLAFAIESASLASWYYDPAKQELGGDRKLAEMYDFPDGPASVSTWVNRLVPEDREPVAAAFAAALEGEPYDVDFRVDVRGSIHWINSKGRLVDDNGSPLFIGICEDITAEINANQLLQATGEMATWDWDLQNNQISWKGSEWAYGRSSDQVDTPEKCFPLIHPDDLTMLQNTLEPVTASPSDLKCEFALFGQMEPITGFWQEHTAFSRIQVEGPPGCLVSIST